MGLVDDLVKEQERRRLSKLEVLEAEAARRDLDTSLGGASNLRDDRGFFTNAIVNPLKRGTTESIGTMGSGMEAVGERLQRPKREKTIKEYQSDLNQEIGRDLATQVADSEKAIMDDSLVAAHIPTNIELKAAHGTPLPTSRKELEEAFTPVGDTYTGDQSTMLHVFRPYDPRTGKMVKRQLRDLPFEEMTPLEQNVQIAKNAVGEALVEKGTAYVENARKIIKDNPQWQFPEHLQGRPAFKSLWADDLTFGDKATIVTGTFMENFPQIATTVGLTVGGAAISGPPGAIAGGAIALGGNFLLMTGDVYDSIITEHPNIDKGDAAGTAITYGFAASALELAPMGALLNKIPGVKRAVVGATLRELLKKPKLMQRMAYGMIEQGAIEATTEGLQELGANVARSVYQQNPEYFKNVDESVFMGWLMGLFTAGFATMTTHRSAIKQFNDERLVKLNSDQLLELANSPDILAQEKISPREVYQAAEQVRIAEGLETLHKEMEEGGLSLEELAGTEAEQAARYLARIRDPERSTSISKARAMIRERNLSDEDLDLLSKSSKALEEVGLLPQDITSLVEERAEEKRYVKHFEKLLENAPSDAVRQGIMDSLQGAYYQGISRVLEARGKKASRTALMKGEVKIPEKKKAAPKKKKTVAKKDFGDLTNEEIKAMGPEERARAVLGKDAKPEEVEVLVNQIKAFQEKEKVEVKPKPKPRTKLDTVYKTKAAAIVAINRLEDKENHSILKTKDGFKIIAEPVLGSAKDVVDTASKALGSEVKYDSSMDQGEDFGVWHGYTFLDGPAKGGSFTVITQSGIEPTAEEIINAGQKIINTRKPSLASSSNFKQWFKDSKVTNDKNEPQIVYHGTSADLTSFDPEKRGTVTKVSSAEEAFFFTSEPEQATDYAYLSKRRTGGNEAIYPVYLSIQNPLTIELKGDESLYGFIGEKVREAKEKGHDGLILKKSWDTPRTGYLTINGEVFDFDFRGSDFDTNVRDYHRNPTKEKHSQIQEEMEYHINFLKEELQADYTPSDDIKYIKEEKALWEKGLKAWKNNPEQLAYVSPPIGTTYAVFSPNQIKSVFNKGDFDSTKADILSAKSSESQESVTVTEAEKRVKKLLKGLPKFIKITDQLDPEVQKALDNRAKTGAIPFSLPLASSTEFLTAPRWSSRIITDFVDKAGHKTAEKWIESIQQWTTDKTKKGKVIPGSASMPGPVQDELWFSGLPEWLDDRKDKQLPTTKKDIIEYLNNYSRYLFTEKIFGYDYRQDIAKKLAESETKPLYEKSDEVRRNLTDLVHKKLDPEIQDHINWVHVYKFAYDLIDLYIAYSDDTTARLNWNKQQAKHTIITTFADSHAGHRFGSFYIKRENFDKYKHELSEDFTINDYVTKKRYELLSPLIDEIIHLLDVSKFVKRDIERLENKYKPQEPAEADSHALRVLQDGSSNENQRSHVLNIPNARKRVFVIKSPDGIKYAESSGAYAVFDTIEAAEKRLNDIGNLTKFNSVRVDISNWTIDTEFIEEDFKEKWSPVHYSGMNNVMWLRADVREHAADLKKVFMISEIQSDWIQQAKKHGPENKSKFNAARDKAKKAEFWAEMSFKKILDTKNTAIAVADPTSREAFGLFHNFALTSLGQPLNDVEIAEILDDLTKLEGQYLEHRAEFSMMVTASIRMHKMGETLKNYWDREIPGHIQEQPDYEEWLDEQLYEMKNFLMDPPSGRNLQDIIQRAKAEGRQFKGYAYEEHIQGYPGLTKDFLTHLSTYVITQAPNSSVTAADIRNLNDVTFRNQFRKLGERMPVFKTAYKLLSRKQLEKVQELFALWTDAAKYTSTIPRPPMLNTFHLYGLKRAAQQAVIEGLDYVAWPSSPRQVANIESYGEILSTPKGKHVVYANREHLEAMMPVYPDPENPNASLLVESVEEVLDLELDKQKRDLVTKTLEYNPIPTTYKNVTAIVNRYIQDMPRAANKFFKKYGTKVELIDLAGRDTAPDTRIPVQGFRITPELKQAILKGLPVASQTDVYQAAYYKGNIHLAAGTLETIDDIKGLLVHEGGHYLRRNDIEYQEKYQQLWDRFISLAMNPTSTRESIAIAEAFQKAMREKDVLDNDLVREEALMYFLQNEANQNLSLWKKFVNLIKQWLHRTFGLTPEQLNMSGQELADVIIRDLRKAVKEAKTFDTEVAVETEKALGAARKRDDIKEYKPGKANKILDDVFGVYVDRKTTEAQHAKDLAIALANLEKNSRDASVQAMSHLTSRIIRNDLGNVKAFKRRKHEQTSSWLNRVFSSPEYYFTKDTTANRILNIAKNKNDIKYQWKKRVEGDFITTVKSIKKKNPKAYIKANKYLLNTDKTGKGFRIIAGEEGLWIVINRKNKRIASFTDEQAAIATMIQAEQDYLKKLGYNTDTRDVIEEARWLTNRGFDLTIEDMRRQIKTARDQGNEEPKLPFTGDDGIKNEISLSEAISRMGDLRGTYFPRERQAKEFQLVAQGEGLPNQLQTFNLFIPENEKDFPSLTKLKTLFNRNTPVGKKIRALEKEGYTDIALKPVRNPTGMIFDVPGLLMSMDALLSASDAKLSELELEEQDKLILKTASEQLTLRIADIYKAKGQLSSRLRRSEILWEGYEEDALKALTSYAQRVSTGAAMRETARAMLLAFTGRDVSWKEYKEDNPDASYRSYRMMVKKKAINSTTQKKLYEDVRTYMTYVLKPDTRLDRTIGYFKAAATFKFLGLRLSSAAINMTNMAMAVPATMSAHTGQSITRSWGHITEAADKYMLWRLEQLKLTSDLSSTLQRKLERLSKGIVLTDKDRLIFEDISRRGWDEAQFNHDAARVLQDSPNRVFDSALRFSMYLFGATEKANRAMTIFAAYKAHEHAQKKKKVIRSHEFYMKMAKSISDRAHGTYGKAAKPWLIQKARVLDLPYTFLKFQHNYMLNMAEIGIKGLQNRKKLSAMKNITYMLLAPAILAGTGASLLSKLAFQIIKGLFDEPDPEEQFYQWFEDTFGEDTFMSRGARHGVSGAVFHVNLRGSIQMNNPLPTDLSELAGAPGSIATDLYDSIIYFSKAEWLKGAEKFSPTFLGSAFKARRESTEGVTTSSYLPVFYGTERLKADPMDAILRYLSFNPSRLSSIREKQWKELKVEQMFTKRRSEIKRNINQMLVQGTASEENWAGIFNDIQEYNNRAMAAPDKYRVTLIDDNWIVRAVRDTEIPKKREKIRRRD